jgi:hypothetical protein
MREVTSDLERNKPMFPWTNAIRDNPVSSDGPS